LIIGGWTLLFTIIFLFQDRKKFMILRKQQNMLVPLGIYALLATISSIFSDYRWISFTGSDGQFESLFAILGYLVCCIYILITLYDENRIKIFEKIIWILLLLVACLGILQFTGNDPIRWQWFQKLITPNGYLENGYTITSLFEENRVSLFSYNPNYAGVLLALLSGFCYGMLITEKNIKKCILEAILLLGLLVALIGTSSKAGILTFITTAILSLVFMRKKIKHFGQIVSVIGLFAVLGTVILFTLGAKLPLVSQLKGLFSSKNQQQNPLEEMVTEHEKVCFKYNGISFSVAFDFQEENFIFNVLEGSTMIPLRLSENRDVYYLERQGLDDVTIHPGIIDDTLPLFVITLNGREWMFVKTDQQYYYLNQYLRLEDLQSVERFGFKGYERIATDRGLIWSMTLPLLKESLLLGTGADTFACYYPQNNYKDLYYYVGDAVASSRPHNMYLKIAVESGVTALVALLVFFCWYWIQSVKIYWREDFSALSARIGFACFIAVTIYLICGLTNDSMISVAPVFWCIQGVGLAVNYMNKNE